MAKDGLPDPIVKREVLYGDKPWPLGLKECGRKCLEQGRYMEALLYFHKGGEKEEVEKIAQIAIEEGNAFLLGQIENLWGMERDKKEWETLAERAKELGKNSYAEKAEALLSERA